MRLVYLLLAVIIFPSWFLASVWQSLKDPTLRGHALSRWGFQGSVPPDGIWVHAVSVGEVRLASLFLRAWKNRFPNDPLGLTVTTATGFKAAQPLLGWGVRVTFLPYDLPWVQRRFLKRIQPKLFIIIETELWPHLFGALKRRSIPVAIINATLSERSFLRFKRFSSLLQSCKEAKPLILAQSPNDAKRFASLGFDVSRVQVLPSLKLAVLNEPCAVLSSDWQCFAQRPMWVAGSTRPGEEALCLAAHQTLLKQCPQALLVLAPRHPKRFDEVFGLIKTMGLTVERRSWGFKDAHASVVLLDTLGELTAVYTQAIASLVGGTLSPFGGHNPLEIIAARSALMVGVHDESIRDVLAPLIDIQGFDRVATIEQLTEAVCRHFNHQSAAKQRAERVIQQLTPSRSVLDQTIDQLIQLSDHSDHSGH